MQAQKPATVRDQSQQPVTDHPAAGRAALCVTGHPAPAPWTFDADASLILDVHGYVVAAVDYGCGSSRDCDASGRLIAAAPDLLAALRIALDHINRVQMADPTFYRAAAALVAKAEGRPV